MTLSEILLHERANTEVRRREALVRWRRERVAGQPRGVLSKQFQCAASLTFDEPPARLPASNASDPSHGVPARKPRRYRPRSPYFQITLRPDAIEVYYKRELYLTIEQDTAESKRDYDRIRDDEMAAEALITPLLAIIKKSA